MITDNECYPLDNVIKLTQIDQVSSNYLQNIVCKQDIWLLLPFV